MMNKGNRSVLMLTLLAVGALASACGVERQSSVVAPTSLAANSTGPSTNGSLVGAWISVSTIRGEGTLPASLSQCSNMRLTVTSQTATLALGTLTMSCPGDLAVAGNITGHLGGANVPLTYAGSATQNGQACAFEMNGTGYPLGNDNFRFEYTGTSCLGPIYGTETLRLSTSPPAPTPTPTPTPSPTPTPTPPGGPDAVPLTSVRILNSPLNLGGWPITSAIRAIEIRPNGVWVDFSKKDGPGRWPDYTPPGWDGPLQYTLGMVMSVNGSLFASAPVQFWHGLEASGGPPSQYALNWFYDPARWAPMTYHQPAVGETIGFFACAGDCRNRTDGSGSPVKERTNVVAVTMPDDRGARFTF
jgi:hypothetical protein